MMKLVQVNPEMGLVEEKMKLTWHPCWHREDMQCIR